jgi:general stress protein 26
LIKIPEWIKETFDNYLVCEFTTIKNGKPVTLPLLPFYLPESGKLVVTSSILFSKKVEHVKDNKKVSMLFSNPEGTKTGKHVVLVQGIATADDGDIDHGWEKYLNHWRRKEPYIDAFLAEREKFGWFWKRISILVEPKKITAWKNGDTTRSPEVFGA